MKSFTSCFSVCHLNRLSEQYTSEELRGRFRKDEKWEGWSATFTLKFYMTQSTRIKLKGTGAKRNSFHFLLKLALLFVLNGGGWSYGQLQPIISCIAWAQKSVIKNESMRVVVIKDRPCKIIDNCRRSFARFRCPKSLFASIQSQVLMQCVSGGVRCCSDLVVDARSISVDCEWRCLVSGSMLRFCWFFALFNPDFSLEIPP